MFFKQFYLSCLAHASYLIGDEGEAAVIDPQRDVDFYIEEAAQQNLKIKHIIETHLHADFVSGHIELAQKTGAKIYFGKKVNAQFEHVAVKNNDQIQVGSLQFTFLETPGHTPESICVLVKNKKNPSDSQKLFTGDTLFIGDVGRPDLVSSKGFTAEQMAGMLYDSLHQKILTLPEETEIYPAHGAGSACGKNISNERSSTLDQQKKLNYALQPMTKEKFVQLTCTDLPVTPSYFPFDAELNRKGPIPLASLSKIPPLSAPEVAREINLGTTVVDVRSSQDFGLGHLPSSINIQLAGSFAPWAGTLLNPNKPIILVALEDQVEEARVRLARVGIENVRGYLHENIKSWEKSGMLLLTLSQTQISELHQQLQAKSSIQIIDVRKPSEFKLGHIAHAINIPLDEFSSPHFQEKLSTMNRKQPTAVICQSGYRSSIAVSVLEQYQFEKLYNVVGGTQAWENASLPLSH